MLKKLLSVTMGLIMLTSAFALPALAGESENEVLIELDETEFENGFARQSLAEVIYAKGHAYVSVESGTYIYRDSELKDHIATLTGSNAICYADYYNGVCHIWAANQDGEVFDGYVPVSAVDKDYYEDNEVQLLNEAKKAFIASVGENKVVLIPSNIQKQEYSNDIILDPVGAEPEPSGTDSAEDEVPMDEGFITEPVVEEAISESDNAESHVEAEPEIINESEETETTVIWEPLDTEDAEIAADNFADKESEQEEDPEVSDVPEQTESDNDSETEPVSEVKDDNKIIEALEDKIITIEEFTDLDIEDWALIKEGTPVYNCYTHRSLYGCAEQDSIVKIINAKTFDDGEAIFVIEYVCYIYEGKPMFANAYIPIGMLYATQEEDYSLLQITK